MRWILPILAAAATLAACGTTPRQARIDAAAPHWGRYDAPDKELIAGGQLREGLDELAMYLALGEPAFFWRTSLDGRTCTAFLYGPARFDEQLEQEVFDEVDRVVYTCDGTIVYRSEVSPALPCAHVQAVGSRAVELAAYFDRLPIDRQWDLMMNVLRRGQTADDVYIAFGEAYNTGSEAREDGTDATLMVYLDETGDAYGPELALIGGRLAGWRFPAKRALTPEAEQRRLDAMEKRLIDELREMDRRSAARHRQEMARLNRIQQNQEQIKVALASRPAEAASGLSRDGTTFRGQTSSYTRKTTSSTTTRVSLPPSGGGSETRERPSGRHLGDVGSPHRSTSQCGQIVSDGIARNRGLEGGAALAAEATVHNVHNACIRCVEQGRTYYLKDAVIGRCYDPETDRFTRSRGAEGVSGRS